MAESKLSELGQAAVWYCENGFGIIPLGTSGEGRKHPVSKHGLNDWFDNPEDARKLWTRFPNLNIGIVCGTPSHGLVVIDVDVDEEKDKDGYATLSQWERTYGELPKTATAITGSGGIHYLYRTDRTTMRPSVNEELGIDVRADGSYIVAPPSIHPNGNRYEWQDHPDDVPISTATSGVYDLIDYVQRNGGETNEAKTKKDNGKFRLPEKIGKGGRDNTLFKYASHLRAIGRSDEEILNAVMGANAMRCDPPMELREIQRIVRSACRYERGENVDDLPDIRRPGGGEKPESERSEEKQLAKQGEGEADEAKEVTLAKDGRGRVLQTTSNAKIAIESDAKLDGRLWYNTMGYTRMVTCPVPWDMREGVREITDEDYTGLVMYLERKYDLTKKERIIDAAQFVCRQYERNPVTEWLDSLEWDGLYRVGSLIIAALGATDNEYNRAVERLFMLGAVSRAYEPGCKFDYMPVLVGPQGIGKSRYVSLLAHVPAWYDDNFNSIDGDKAIENLRGLWIAEMAELLATKKAREVEAIKAFITSSKDVIRPKYARETVQRLRVCVFIGTTNDHDFLTDSTGNRRFLPVECNAIEPNPWIFTNEADAYVEQMWAETVSDYKTNHPKLVLPRELTQTAQRLQEAHTEEHPVVVLAHNVIDGLLPSKSNPNYKGTVDERICMREVFLELPEDVRRNGFNKLVQTDIVTALDSDQRLVRMDGRHRTREHGVAKCWIPTR